MKHCLKFKLMKVYLTRSANIRRENPTRGERCIRDISTRQHKGYLEVVKSRDEVTLLGIIETKHVPKNAPVQIVLEAWTAYQKFKDLGH